MDLSIVVPMYEEEGNAALLHEQISAVLDDLKGLEAEIIYINDGSADQTLEELKKAAQQDPRVTVLDLRRNYGQTAAMSAGFDRARGEVIVAMDGDLQNDPSDIPILLEELEKGFDVVSGWRKDRKDNSLMRTFPSWIANWLIGQVTGVKLHDYGCSLKAYRGEILKDVKLYGEMHRFIPALAAWVGGRVTELPVKHHARQHGKAKYGINRTFRVILDLITVKFLLSFSASPLRMFGSFGGISSLIGGGVLLVQTWRKLFIEGYTLADKPIVLAGVFLVLLGVQLFSIGLLAELVVRTYHESQNKPVYAVRTVYTSRKS
ncbi:MAG: glycosyltransferase family 2 protein [Acidobacteriota bacterium]